MPNEGPLFRYDPPAIACRGSARIIQVRYDYTDFQFAAGGGGGIFNAVILYPSPSDVRLVVDHVFADGDNFAGGAVASAVVDVGTVATPQAYLVAADVFSVAPWGLVTAEKPGPFQTGETVIHPATTAIRIALTVAGADIAALTRGDVAVFLRVWDVPAVL